MKQIGKTITGGSLYSLKSKSIVDDAITEMRHLADSMPHGSMSKDRARARAIGEVADRWKPKIESSDLSPADKQSGLNRIHSFIRAYL